MVLTRTSALLEHNEALLGHNEPRSKKAIPMSRLDWRLIEFNLCVYCFVGCLLYRSDFEIWVNGVCIRFADLNYVNHQTWEIDFKRTRTK